MAIKKPCPICAKIALLKKGGNPDLVREFRQSFLVMGFNQHFKGYAILLLKRHVREPHQLSPVARRQLFEELMRAGNAVWRCFKPWKLNYASLGNEVPHVHWHIIPRYKKGPAPWLVREFAKGKPAPERMRRRLAVRLGRFL
jgi:diadenosine tetraphosphate (Ap4A) HIT family hydrolase